MSEYTQGCSDGGCCLRIGTVGQHTNGGCRCLRDVPTELRGKIMRKFAHERQRLAAAEAAMKAVASLPGKDWLIGQLALAELLDGKGGKHLQYALVMYRAAKGGRDE